LLLFASTSITLLAMIRLAILERLEQLGQTPAWLARQAAPHVSRTSIYGYLNGHYPISVASAERLMAIVGITLQMPN
jgi:hypothetical protein